jgi:acyl-CoA synthetase (AMP-forming)/AMP-acid ligase II
MVRETAVITEPDPKRGEKIIACVVLRDGFDKEQVRRFCGIEMPRYMQPVRYVAITSIPRNPSGKYDLNQLKAEINAAASSTASRGG